MQLKNLPGIKSGFQVYTSTRIHEGNWSLSMYLLHSLTNELFTIDINDAVKGSGEIQIVLPPKVIADIVENKYEKVRISENAEVEIQLEMQGWRVIVKLPPPRRDHTYNAAADIRIRHIERNLKQRIGLLEQRNTRLQEIVKSQQMVAASLQRELRHQSQHRLSELRPLQPRKISSTQDEQTQIILREYKENRERELLAMVRQQTDHVIQNLRRDSQQLEEIINNTIERVSARFTQIVERNMNETNHRIVCLEQKLEAVRPKIGQNVAKKGGQRDPFTYFQAQFEESQYNPVQTNINTVRLQIRNHARPVKEQNDTYCYFFSKPPITHSLTLRLKVTKGEKPLFGVCSKEALQARPIYKQSTAFFYIISNEKCWLAGLEQDDCDQGGRVDGGDEAVMRVSVEEGVIMWESQGKIFRHQFGKDFLTQNQLHVAVLMKRQDENEVILQYQR